MKYTTLIKPNSKKGPLVEKQVDGSLVVYIREPATEGKANNALIELLADFFDVPKTSIEILRGHKSRNKVIEVEGMI